MLGKRKERDESNAQEDSHGSTLFVSNLPYTATSTDLQTLFSDIAPVRSAFVVLEQGTGVSKGVGYVSFAIREDAQLAFDQIAKEGLVLDRRSLRVQWADQKPKDKSSEEMEKEKEKPKVNRPARTPQVHTPQDPLAIRTIVISGLPSSIDSKSLWKKLRKYIGCEKVEWPFINDAGKEESTTAHALFDTPASAQDAVSRLHAHVFKGALLSVTLKKRLDGLVKVKFKPKSIVGQEPAQVQPSTIATAAPSRASRLIVRNLPWNVTEQDLRALFLPHGPVYSVHIPVSADGRGRGFAFVWMLSRKNAEKAMEECNGAKVRAGMAEGLVGDKQKRKKLRREEKKGKGNTLAVADGEENEDGEEKDEKVEVERVIAVDWALSKEKWEEEKGKIEGEEDMEMSEAIQSDDSDESGSEDNLGVHDDSDDVSNSDGSQTDHTMDDEDDSPPQKPQLPPPKSGTTLFVRNVPFEATDDDLRTLFRAFGPLRYARITKDSATGRSCGTGFVCFWNKADVDKAVEQSELIQTEANAAVTAPKKNPFTLPSILTPDPSSAMAQSLVMHGRTLNVVRAVTREEAEELKEAGEKQREKADKRNLYLMREGVIFPNTPAAETLTKLELEKRTQAFNGRRALLKSNPSLYVSKTRLSVRQLPLFATERVLKRLAVHAIRSFEAEVKNNLRVGLTEDELLELNEEDDEENEEKKDKGKGKAKGRGERQTAVKQAKIVRQADRVDPFTGKGRSKGYGFLELRTHADALRVLRWANNNAEIGGLLSEWWQTELEDLVKEERKKLKGGRENAEGQEAKVKRMEAELERLKGQGDKGKKGGPLVLEFSIENVQVVKRRAAIQTEKNTFTREPKVLPKLAFSDSPLVDASPGKKRKLVNDRPAFATKKKTLAPASDMPGKSLGRIIGRKRKQRQSKHGG